VILKCLEKDKNNRYADVTALAAALQEVLDHAREASNPLATPLPAAAMAGAAQSQPRMPATPGADLLETRKGELPNLAPPAMPAGGLSAPGPTPPQGAHGMAGHRIATPGAGTPIMGGVNPGYPQAGGPGMDRAGAPSYMPPPAQPAPQMPMVQGGASESRPVKSGGGSKLIWWIVGLLVLGAGAGAVAAYFLQ
jgi:hypothetical protein